MTRLVGLRIAVLVVAAAGILIGLTAYFSSQKLPPCLASDAGTWRPPRDGSAHRFLVVVPDRALCFFSIDDGNALVGAIELKDVEGVTAIAPRGDRIALRYGNGRGALVDVATGRVALGVQPPPPSPDVLRVRQDGVEYSTGPGEFGFRVQQLATGRVVHVRPSGFTWNPRFGPDPPDHGLALSPDGSRLWLLDAPNSTLHLYDTSPVPTAPPRHVDDIRLSQPLSGDENPCARPRCERLGSLLYSADGRFLYVGDAGDVYDAQKRELLVELEALRQSRLMLELDWVGGRPTFPR
jgi:hypothetical protein